MYRRVLIVVDSRLASRAAVLEGTALAKAHAAEVLFFALLPTYVVPIADMPMFATISPKQFEREARIAANRMLAAATVFADKAGVASRPASAAGEDAAKVIAAAAQRRKCDVIVVASEGRNALLRLLTGSVIPGLITASPVPVLVCKPKPATARRGGPRWSRSSRGRRAEGRRRQAPRRADRVRRPDHVTTSLARIGRGPTCQGRRIPVAWQGPALCPCLAGWTRSPT